LGQIAAQEEFIFKVSDVKNPPSTRPTLESIVYLMVDKQGNTLEEKLEGLEIRNTVAGDFVEGQSSVQPSSFDGGVANRYSFAFKPTNYEQDMLVKIKSPSTIPIESVDNVVCFGEEGTDTQQLLCEFSTLTGEITIKEAFTYQENKPELVRIGIESFVNPDKGAVTGSFKIYTFTFDGYKLDAQERDLTVNFYCEFPCKTCDPFDFEVCYSCFIGDTFQNWHDFDCYTTCPSGFTATGSNNCTACVEPCATCSETTSTCTSCASGFMLYKDNKCIEEVFYPFPWLLIAIVWFVIILVSEISTKGVSKFKEAYIAMLSISEFGSWVTFIALCVHRQGFKPAAIVALAALGCSLCLNAAHAFLHVKKIVP
jgi:hypothetical protein